jgi:hypothetical protein
MQPAITIILFSQPFSQLNQKETRERDSQKVGTQGAISQ